MSSETGELPLPVSSSVAFAWFALLEGLTVAALVVFAISMFESGGLIPDILAEWSVGLGAFVTVTALSFYLKWRS